MGCVCSQHGRGLTSPIDVYTGSRFSKVVIVAILAFYVAIHSFALTADFFPLDDLQELAVVNGLDHWWQVFGSDAFKLFRPVKNILFCLFSFCAVDSVVWSRVAALLVGCLSLFPVLALFKRIFNEERCALAAAMAWMLAPTLVSSIAWLSCVNIQVMCAMGAAAVVLHDMAFEREDPRPSVVACSAACIFLACVSYECAVAVGPLVVVFDFFLRPRRFATRQAWCAYVVYAVVTVGYLLLRNLVGSASSLNGNFVNATPLDMSMASAYFTCQHFFVWFWPFGKMTPLGSYSPGEVPLSVLLGCWVVVAVLAMLALYLRRRRPLPAFGIAFAFVAFLPVSNILGFGNGPYGDYYLGLPSIGLVVVAVVLCREMLCARGRFHYVWFAIAVAVVVSRIAAAPEAARWAWLWADGARAFESGAQAFPDVYGNRLMLAKVYYEAGKVQQAMDCCDWLESRLGADSDKMGFVYQLRALEAMNCRRDAESAMKFLDSAARVDKVNKGGKSTRFLRGCVFEDLLEDLKSAETEYRAAIAGKWSVDTPAAADRLARLLALRGDFAEAEVLWTKALKYQPSNAVLRHNLLQLRHDMSAKGGR